MLNKFSEWLSNIFDETFAPAEALSSGIEMSSASNGFGSAGISEPEWHNGFGTLNDFEVPASGCTTFEDWSSGGMGCGSDPFDTW